MVEYRELYAGRKLGRYELLVPLAQGATAQVWAARTIGSHLEKIVAVKAMLTELCGDADMDAESMFLDEARLVSLIRHPNVGTVLDLGEEEDVLYIVMDWIEGEPLQVVMREAKGRLPLSLALRIVKQAAAGLHAAHELRDEDGKLVGLVHRDVSPQNVLVGYDGVVKVIDFGVAKAASNLQRTSVGQIKGKVPYMAPEQAVGDKVDRRTDVFALGVVLYQLVTGKHPFRGESEFATLARIRDKKPADSPLRHVPDLPPALAEAMLKALAKQRDDRFATMNDLARALERAVPSASDGDRMLGAYLSELVSERASKREQSIREALRERTGTDARPVNLGVRPTLEEGSSGIRHVRALLDGRVPADEADPAARPSMTGAPASATPLPSSAPAPPIEAPAKPATAVPPSVPVASPDEARPSFLPLPSVPGLRPLRARATLIAVAIAVAIALVLGLLAASGGSSSGDSPTRRAF